MISISEFPPIPGNQTPIWHTKEVYKLVLFVRAFIYLGMPFGACHCTPGEEQELGARALPWALSSIPAVGSGSILVFRDQRNGAGGAVLPPELGMGLGTPQQLDEQKLSVRGRVRQKGLVRGRARLPGGCSLFHLFWKLFQALVCWFVLELSVGSNVLAIPEAETLQG